ncbi:hypothetical protein Cgig2_013789 [Carnegiea gigantea]|uniref:Aminotransferase-like plant mobile domain-containing protein n=1 Tax=Carnegiea gigantea TaxID=171969 RepID=A0A9Q1Q4Y0_9CARY|nr:hypothetical protein Cgig2_013789 [Carnegiea gigantea]
MKVAMAIDDGGDKALREGKKERYPCSSTYLMELYAFNPGPMDDSVLYDQEKHVSSAVWEGQCWSYYHLNIGRPKLTQDTVYDSFPLVLRWKGKQSGPGTNRDLTFYRKALDSLKPTDVEWFPYGNIDPRIIPDEIASSLILGRSKTMLICFDKAERHLPDRCLRQYGNGICQPIPDPVERWERKSRGVDGGVDLSGKMESELKDWSERHLNIVQCEEGADDGKYMHWYLRITRRFVGRPIPLASEFQRMVSLLVYVHDFLKLLCKPDVDQAGSFVTVASPLPEDENCNKRGRGKEKVRRKGVGKRRRKDDLEFFQVETSGRDDHQLIPNYAAAGIEYIEQMHHSVGLIDHPNSCHPDDVGVDELCHPEDNVSSPQMDDSQICISVNEAGDPQICLGNNDLEEPCQLPDQVTQIDHENGLMERENSSSPNSHADTHEESEASQSLEVGAEAVLPPPHENGGDEDISQHPDHSIQETT